MDLMISVISSGHLRNIRELPPENTNEDKITTDIFPPDLKFVPFTKKGDVKNSIEFFRIPLFMYFLWFYSTEAMANVWVTFSFVTEEIPDSNWILRKQTFIINLFFCYCIYSSRPTYIFQLESFIIILDNLTAKSHLHFLLCCFLVIFYIFFKNNATFQYILIDKTTDKN